MLGDQPLARREGRHDGFADDGLEERFLALEVQIHRPLGHAGFAGHVVELRSGEAALHEHLESGGYDLGGSRCLATLPARLGRALRGYGVTHSGPQELVTERTVTYLGSRARQDNL